MSEGAAPGGCGADALSGSGHAGGSAGGIATKTCTMVRNQHTVHGPI